MTYEHVVAADIAALSSGDIADKLGDLDALVEPLLTQRKLIRAEMTRRRLRRAVGVRWAVDRSVKTPHEIDIEAIRNAMGTPWLERFCKRGLQIGFAIARHAGDAA